MFDSAAEKARRKQQKEIEKQKLLAQLKLIEAQKQEAAFRAANPHSPSYTAPPPAPKRTPKTSPKYDAPSRHTTPGIPKKRFGGGQSKASSSNPREDLRRTIESEQRKRRVKLFARCEFVWKRVKAHKWSWPFAEPVDWRALNIPDYPTIVKNPMDLQTISKKLENTMKALRSGAEIDPSDTSMYSSPMQFDKDMRLMFDNCFLYNKAGTDVAVMGEKVKQEYEDKWSAEDMERKLEAEEKLKEQEARDVLATPQTAHMREPVSRNDKASFPTDSTIPRKPSVPDQPSHGQNDRSRSKNGPRSHQKRPGNGGGGTAKKQKREMTFDEKRMLSEDLGALPQEKLCKVVEIIAAQHDIGDETEIELDIDQLELDTLWELHRFVQKHKNEQKAQAEGAGSPAMPPQSTPADVNGVAGNESDSDAEGSNEGADTKVGDVPDAKANGEVTLPNASAPEPTAKILEAPSTAEQQEVAIANADAWGELKAGANGEPSAPATAPDQDVRSAPDAANADAAGNGAEPKDALWSEFQQKEKLAEQREAARKEEEEALRRQKEEEAARAKAEQIAASERMKQEAEKQAAAERARIEALKAAEIAEVEASANATEDMEAQRAAMEAYAYEAQ